MNCRIFTSFVLVFMLHGLLLKAQNDVFRGRFVKGSENCPVLIKLNKSSSGNLPYHYIMPSGGLPPNYQLGDKINFNMTPLRQPIPAGCKAGVVASISIIQDNQKKQSK
ncbi:MAG: hypothetical protein ACK5QU_01890 [Bacteroidota bacterium]